MWSPSLKAYYNTIEKIFTDILLKKTEFYHTITIANYKFGFLKIILGDIHFTFPTIGCAI